MGIHVSTTQKGKQSLNKRKFTLKVGDMVRISHLSKQFKRSYDQQRSTEIFIICDRFLLQAIPIYKLKSFKDEIIRGTFYSAEL